MKMHNPPHPGEVILDLCIEPLEITITEAAQILGVHRRTLSLLINGRSGISTEMAFRLEKVFGSTAKTWIDLQTQYDLWKMEQNSELQKKIKGLKKAA